jgi:hypothetical protein
MLRFRSLGLVGAAVLLAFRFPTVVNSADGADGKGK